MHPAVHTWATGNVLSCCNKNVSWNFQGNSLFLVSWKLALLIVTFNATWVLLQWRMSNSQPSLEKTKTRNEFGDKIYPPLWNVHKLTLDKISWLTGKGVSLFMMIFQSSLFTFPTGSRISEHLDGLAIVNQKSWERQHMMNRNLSSMGAMFIPTPICCTIYQLYTEPTWAGLGMKTWDLPRMEC